MSQKTKSKQPAAEGYKKTLRNLQIELTKLQRHLIKNELQILILFEGRDAAGKDGVIKRITQHLSPRETLRRAPAPNRGNGPDEPELVQSCRR